MTLVPRVTANATDVIANISPSRWDQFVGLWGGYSNTTTEVMDPGSFLLVVSSQYPDIVGPIAYLILFAIPFIMMWIAHADMVPAAIIGIFFGLYISFYIGGSYFNVGLLFIGIAFTSVIWSLAQKRG